MLKAEMLKAEKLRGENRKKLSAEQVRLLREVWIEYRCAYCEHRGGAMVEHYTLVRCKCGMFSWALRPRRDGPLEMFPWPGDARHTQPAPPQRHLQGKAEMLKAEKLKEESCGVVA